MMLGAAGVSAPSEAVAAKSAAMEEALVMRAI
jgi:hypothetical protein